MKILNIEKFKYPCYHCEYKATAQSSLKTHNESVHMKVKHRCNLCGKQFTQKRILKVHMELTPMNVRTNYYTVTLSHYITVTKCVKTKCVYED